jgi:hypothetical protein
LRARAASFAEWLASGSDEIAEVEEIVVGGEKIRRGIVNSAANRRAFIETHAAEFDVNALSMVELPLRLKRKLCIEWNHLYVAWLNSQRDTWYDFDDHEFYREIDEAPPATPGEVKEWWSFAGFGGPS